MRDLWELKEKQATSIKGEKKTPPETPGWFKEENCRSLTILVVIMILLSFSLWVLSGICESKKLDGLLDQTVLCKAVNTRFKCMDPAETDVGNYEAQGKWENDCFRILRFWPLEYAKFVLKILSSLFCYSFELRSFFPQLYSSYLFKFFIMWDLCCNISVCSCFTRLLGPEWD